MIARQTVYFVDGYISVYMDDPEPDALLPPVAREAFNVLWREDFDNASCQSVNHPEGVRGTVGFALHGDRDESVRFHSLSIVIDTDDEGAETAWFLCEDCSAVLDRKPDLRPATESEAAQYLAGHLRISGAVETEHGLMVPNR